MAVAAVDRRTLVGVMRVHALLSAPILGRRHNVLHVVALRRRAHLLVRRHADGGDIAAFVHLEVALHPGNPLGNLLGYEPKDGDRVVMVEDVTTSGKSIDETYPKLMNAANVEVKGLIVSLNRMEVGKGGVVTAQQEVQEKYGFPVASIVSMAEVTEHLYNRECQGKVVIDDKLKAAIDAYYEQYGVK